jgi:hypothetical protein
MAAKDGDFDYFLNGDQDAGQESRQSGVAQQKRAHGLNQRVAHGR